MTKEVQGSMATEPGMHIIGVHTDTFRLEDVQNLVLDRTEKNIVGSYICVANIHTLVTARLNPDFSKVVNKSWRVVSDGMPLVWLLKRKFPWAERVAGPDLTERLCHEMADQGMPVFFYGGRARELPRLKKRLLAVYPSLKLSCEAPPELPERPGFDQCIVDKIKKSGARVVFVGLGCPKQEYWMHVHAPHIPAVLIGVGAAFDFIAGTKGRAPKWMQKMGLEWLYRLASEPRRLWKRYLVTNSLFVYFLLVDKIRSIISGKQKDGR
ncbi:MAG: glycosyltransferase [Gammaproteobacteria bacterium]|nr:MAG: glycosyltransferase [Gammaproteobacteria bacterium]